MRIAQNLCYCRNWSEYKKVEPTRDPFGRPPKTVGLMPEPYVPPAPQPHNSHLITENATPTTSVSPNFEQWALENFSSWSDSPPVEDI